ncbi:MAG: hypothetical protein KDC92_15630, partial [Bacteroidetes bacterium]|nr:hypothetical protein [Bacteroidota bacterium]
MMKNKILVLLLFVVKNTFAQDFMLFSASAYYKPNTSINAVLNEAGLAELSPFAASFGLSKIVGLEENSSLILGFDWVQSLTETDSMSISNENLGFSLGANQWIKKGNATFLGVGGQVWFNINSLEFEKTNQTFPNGFNLNNPQWQTGKFIRPVVLSVDLNML